MPEIELRYGDDFLSVNIPDEWLGEIVAQTPVQPAVDPLFTIKKSLSHPAGTVPLEQLAQPGKKVSILVDDYTRKTPARLLITEVLQTLKSAGVKPEDITIIIALGTHRPMTSTEINLKLGDDVQGKYCVINVSAEDEGEFTYLGVTPSGIPVWILRALLAADLRIGLGMITPHMDAGFSGGAKIVLPGACSMKTVDAFHALAIRQPENQLGNPEAHLRKELEHFVSRWVPLHFILNLILTPDEQVYECVAGEAVSAHREGIAYARVVYGVPVRRRYPLVLANCYPYAHDLWQSMKGLWCGELLTQNEGTLVLLAHASEGNSNYPMLPKYIGQDPDELLAELTRDQTADPKAAATGILVGKMKQRIRLALVSQALTREDALQMGFDWYPDLSSALEEEFTKIPIAQRRACLAILPQAGVTLPLLQG